MSSLLFSPQGRIGRGQFWLGVLFQLILAGVANGVLFGLGMSTPGTFTDDGVIHLQTGGILIVAVVALVWLIPSVWSGLCISIKRYHDRDKSGWWVLIQLVPAIGPIWYFIETGFLAGTAGPNRFGADPRAPMMQGGYAV